MGLIAKFATRPTRRIFTPKRSAVGRRFYHQCVLSIEMVWGCGVVAFASTDKLAFYTCLLRGKRIPPPVLAAREYKHLLVDDTGPAVELEYTSPKREANGKAKAGPKAPPPPLLFH